MLHPQVQSRIQRLMMALCVDNFHLDGIVLHHQALGFWTFKWILSILWVHWLYVNIIRCKFSQNYLHVHALCNSWPLKSQLPTQFSNSIVKSIFPKDWMVNMKRMSNFIQRMFFRNQQFVIWSNSIFLEKETNFITRFYEILIRCLTRYDRINDIASNYP